MPTPSRDSSMAVGAANLAFGDLGFNGGQFPAGSRHRSDVSKFVPAYVIEFKNNKVVLTAIHARVGRQVLQDVCLGGRDSLLFACAALCVLLGRSPVVRPVVFVAAVATVGAPEHRTILTAARAAFRGHHLVLPSLPDSAPTRTRT